MNEEKKSWIERNHFNYRLLKLANSKSAMGIIPAQIQDNKEDPRVGMRPYSLACDQNQGQSSAAENTS